MPTLETVDGVTVITPEGDLEHEEMSGVRAAISESLRGGNPFVVLDLEGLDHVDYRTVGVLVERRARLRALGGDLRLAGPSDYVTKILRYGAAHERFQSHDTLAEAIASYVEEPQATAAVFRGQRSRNHTR